MTVVTMTKREILRAAKEKLLQETYRRLSLVDPKIRDVEDRIRKRRTKRIAAAIDKKKSELEEFKSKFFELVESHFGKDPGFVFRISNNTPCDENKPGQVHVSVQCSFAVKTRKAKPVNVAALYSELEKLHKEKSALQVCLRRLLDMDASDVLIFNRLDEEGQEAIEKILESMKRLGVPDDPA